MNISHILIRIDQTSNLIPFVSSVTNAVDLIAKCILFKCLKMNHTNRSYLIYLSKKPAYVCAFLLIPFAGNILFILAAVKQRRSAQMQRQQELKKFYADCTQELLLQQPLIEAASSKKDANALLACSLSIHSLAIKSFKFTIIWPHQGYHLNRMRDEATIKPVWILYQNTLQKVFLTLESQKRDHLFIRHAIDSVKQLLAI